MVGSENPSHQPGLPHEGDGSSEKVKVLSTPGPGGKRTRAQTGYFLTGCRQVRSCQDGMEW